MENSKIEIETVRPFDNGSQYADWTGSNCDRCTQGVHRLGPDAWYTCALEEALATACFGDGEITLDIAKRIGMEADERRYGWPCTEVEWTEEWKAEWAKRHPEQSI